MDETLEQLLLSPLVYFLFDSTKLALESPRFPRNDHHVYGRNIVQKSFSCTIGDKQTFVVNGERIHPKICGSSPKETGFILARPFRTTTIVFPSSSLSLSPCSTTINYSSGCRTGGLYHPWIRPRLLLEVGKGLERKGVGRIERSGEWQR